jgi:hypothetical protein
MTIAFFVCCLLIALSVGMIVGITLMGNKPDSDE